MAALRKAFEDKLKYDNDELNKLIERKKKALEDLKNELEEHFNDPESFLVSSLKRYMEKGPTSEIYRSSVFLSCKNVESLKNLSDKTIRELIKDRQNENNIFEYFYTKYGYEVILSILPERPYELRVECVFKPKRQ